MDAQQELFTGLKLKLEEDYDVYDGVLPPADVDYPFIYLGETIENSRNIKAGITGSITQTIHVYHNEVRQRGTLSDMLSDIKQACCTLGKQGDHSWSCIQCAVQIIPDNTTSQPLLHGIIDADFIY